MNVEIYVSYVLRSDEFELSLLKFSSLLVIRKEHTSKASFVLIKLRSSLFVTLKIQFWLDFCTNFYLDIQNKIMNVIQSTRTLVVEV